jgi:hypothetical protein
MRGLPQAAAVVVTLGGACGVFSLDDVVSVADGGVDALRPGADARGDSPGNPDGSAVDAATPDGAGPDVVQDSGFVCDGSDGCECPSATMIATYEVPAKVPPNPRALSITGSTATWLDGADEAWVFQAPIDGDGGMATLLPLPYKYWIPAGDFVPAASGMYFAVYFPQAMPVTWDMARASYDAAADDPLLQALPSAPSDVTATLTSVIWTNANAEICSMGLDGSIRAGDSGCGGAAFSPGQPGADGGNHALVSANGIWLAVRVNGELLRIPLAGGPGALVTTLAPGVSRALVGDDNAVFWAETPKNAEAGLVYAESHDGGGAAVLASVPVISGVAADSTQVYVLSGPAQGPNQILSVSRTGGPLSLVACPAAASAFAVDAQYVYWVNINGQLWRAPKFRSTSGG